MNKLMPIITLILIITCCTESKKNLSTREIAISLIEKEYKVDGRKLEYSQVDSTDAELQGYFIARVYISNDDSIKSDVFHLNYAKTKINISKSFNIELELYKKLLKDNRIYSDNLEMDSKRIKKATLEYYGINLEEQQRYRDSISKVLEKQNNKY